MASWAPTSLSATSTSSSTIYLTWDNNYNPAAGSYSRILIQYSTDGSTYSDLRRLGGAAENYTHSSPDANTTYYYRVYGKYTTWEGPSNVDTATCWTSAESDTSTTSTVDSDSIYGTEDDTVTEYVAITESITSTDSVPSTITDTVTTSEAVSSTQTIQTNHAYYLGTANGTTHLHSLDYKGDGGSVVSTAWQGKDADFGDQFPEVTDLWKTYWGAKLYYEDLEAIDVTVSLSVDGGVTWVSQQRNIGSGAGTTKSAMFYFHLSGYKVIPKITHGSASTTFKWLGLEIEFEEAGEHWDTV